MAHIYDDLGKLLEEWRLEWSSVKGNLNLNVDDLVQRRLRCKNGKTKFFLSEVSVVHPSYILTNFYDTTLLDW